MRLTGSTHRDNDNEHECGAVGIPQLLGLLGLALERLLLAVEQPLPLLFRFLHRPEKKDVQDDQRDAGNEVDEEDAEPESEGEWKLKNFAFYS